ncbi:MAG: class I SAM-dependent methyltransferase [Candidatus Acidiferrales bacterium]
MTTPEEKATCKSCSSTNLSVFYRLDGVPVNSCLLFDNRQDAQNYPKGELALGFCGNCGFISNLSFDSQLARYTEGYEEQQSFSARFNAFARDLATRLIERHDLRNKTVVEVGCGKGDFLLLLCDLGNNRGIGIDPTYVPGRNIGSASERVTFIRDFYSERYAQYTGEMVCCRHTLEHISDTAAFMQTVRRALGDKAGTIVFFELPDVERVLRECAFWDIYYEHCSYFSLGSLARLFRRCGFEVTDLAKEYDGQYLLIEARPANGNHGLPLKEEETVEDLSKAVAQFQNNYQETVRRWKRKIETIRETGQRGVIWGSSSKCVAFLNTIGIRDEIEFVVDINPHRQGKYLPGSGKLIVAPDFLKEYRPDVVIAMNPIYLDEIRSDLNSLGLHPELTAV